MAVYLSGRIWQHPRFRPLSVAAKGLYLRAVAFVAQAHSGSALFDDAVAALSEKDPAFAAAMQELAEAGLVARLEGWYVLRNLRGEPISVTASPEVDDPDETAGVWFVPPRDHARDERAAPAPAAGEPAP